MPITENGRVFTGKCQATPLLGMGVSLRNAIHGADTSPLGNPTSLDSRVPRVMGDPQSPLWFH